MTERTKPLPMGAVVGWLKVLWSNPKRTQCECRCGAVILRETANLAGSVGKMQIPKRKKCERVERKRKNPNGGGVPGIRVHGIARLGGT